MRKLFLFLIGIITLTSCSRNAVFEQHTKLDNNRWNRFNQLKFDAKIEKSGTYNVYVAVRHADFYQFANINIDLEMVKPNGENQIVPLEIKLKNEKGEFLGKGAGDIWDFEYLVFEKANFAEPGNYHFELDNVMPVYDLPGIMEIGLVIEEAK